MTISHDLRSQVEAWIAEDPNEHDAAELRPLLDDADLESASDTRNASSAR